MTKIEWTERTWNPVTGCDKIGAGCDNCYASRFAERFRGTAGHPFEMGFDLQERPDRIHEPFDWEKPTRVFVCSMSDLFHKDISRPFLDFIFRTMETADWHTFQVLTKRSSLMRDYILERYKGAQCPKHIWLGVSVENRKAASRVGHLLDTPCKVRFLSMEPLLEPVMPELDGISWVIVGGESGPKFRPMKPEWVRPLRDQCHARRICFFFKQWGGLNPKWGGRKLDGRTWDEVPPYYKTGVPPAEWGWDGWEGWE